MRRTLVAGGAGFLGSHLCETLLDRGHEIVCLDNFQTGSRTNIAKFADTPRFHLVEHDVREPLPASLEIDEVYNLACPASPPHYQDDPVGTLLTCVNGTQHLLQQAGKWNARFVQASTSEIYGDPLHHPQKEEDWGNVNPVGIRACYDEGKRAAETLCFDHQRQYGTDVRIARIFNTYGARMRRDDGRVVSNLICQALENQPLTLYGDGRQTRSFCHVSDLLDGLIALMDVQQNPGIAINLGNPQETAMEELANLVLSLTGSASQVVFKPLPQDDPRRRRPDITRAREILGWEPRVSLEAGLRNLIEWFAPCGGHEIRIRALSAQGAPRQVRI